MGVIATLAVSREGANVKTCMVSGEAVLGRSEGCSIRLDDKAISRQHAVFRTVGDEFQVEKKSEFAPLAVNGIECTRAVLKEGDMVMIGPYAIRVGIAQEKNAKGAKAANAVNAGMAAPNPVAAKPASAARPPPPPPMSYPAPTAPVGFVAPTLEEAPSVMEGPPGAFSLLQDNPLELKSDPPASDSQDFALSPPEVGLSAVPELPSFDQNDSNDMAEFEMPLGDNKETPSAPSDLPADSGLELPLDPRGGSNDSDSGSMMPDLGSDPAPASDPAPFEIGNGDLNNNEQNIPAIGEPNPEGSIGGLGLVPESGNSQPSIEPSGGDGFDDGATKVFSGGKLSVTLVFAAGTANVEEYLIDKDEVSIGRGKQCDIVLNDKKSSRKNSIIRRAGSNFTILDLNSANGTYVNGLRIQEQELAGEDMIKIGSVEFQFKAMSADYVAKEKDFMSLPAEAELEPELEAEPDQNQMMAPPPPNDGMMTPPPDVPAYPLDPYASGTDAQGIAPEAQPYMAPDEPAEFGNILGVGGAGGKQAPKSLWGKFKALPRRTRIITMVVIVLILFTLDDPPEPKKAAPVKKGVIAATGPKMANTFENLTPEQKRFVENQHDLAFNYFKNHDYDKALFEIQKIFAYVDDYKNSREIERYAKEGKRKLEQIEEERRKKEEEEALKRKINNLVEECRGLMDKKLYPQAKELFSQILALDPDNTFVAAWRKEVDAYEEQQRIFKKQKELQAELNQRGWDIYKEGIALRNQGKYHTAIETFQKALQSGANDANLFTRSKKQIAACRRIIRNKLIPVLEEAKRAEDAGEYIKAYKLYKRATRIDPPHPAGYAGMARVRGILHDRAKAIYTEAILAEGYSDFSTARKMYEECLQVAPPDDIYHERAQRKLAHYFKVFKDDSGGGPGQ